MKKKIIIGSVLIILMIMILPSISAMEAKMSTDSKDKDITEKSIEPLCIRPYIIRKLIYKLILCYIFYKLYILYVRISGKMAAFDNRF